MRQTKNIGKNKKIVIQTKVIQTKKILKWKKRKNINWPGWARETNKVEKRRLKHSDTNKSYLNKKYWNARKEKKQTYLAELVAHHKALLVANCGTNKKYWKKLKNCDTNKSY